MTIELMFVRKEAGAEAGAEREVATAVAGQRQVEQQGRYLASNNNHYAFIIIIICIFSQIYHSKMEL